jgi:hypothetical protein
MLANKSFKVAIYPVRHLVREVGCYWLKAMLLNQPVFAPTHRGIGNAVKILGGDCHCDSDHLCHHQFTIAAIAKVLTTIFTPINGDLVLNAAFGARLQTKTPTVIILSCAFLI